MSIRYLWMAAMTAVVVLLFPGAVFANGNGHHSAHGGHQDKNQHGPPEHSQNHGKSGDPHGSSDSSGKAIGRQKHSHTTNGQGHSDNQKGTSGNQHSQAADHASEQAKRHAADHSAVHEAKEKKTMGSGKKKAEHRKDRGKSEQSADSVEPVHKNPKQRHTVDQIQNSVDTKDSVAPRHSERGKSADSLVNPPDPPPTYETVSRTYHTSEIPEKSSSHPQPENNSGPEDVPAPVGVISLSSPGLGSTHHLRSHKGHDSFSGFGYVIAPEWRHSDWFSVQLFVSRRAQYGNQWINAPPSPPPKNASLFL